MELRWLGFASWMVLVFVGALLGPVPAAAQEPGAAPQGEMAGPAGPPAEVDPSDEIERLDFSDAIRLESHEIPEYNVVSAFFRRAYQVTQIAPHAQDHFLKSIGIEPGTPAAEFFAEVREAAFEAMMIDTVDGSLLHDEEAFLEAQYAALSEKARRLGVIYRNLLLGLKEADVSVEPLIRYCEEIRESLYLASTEADNSRYIEAVSSFDEELEGIDIGVGQ